jgi:hypothetical protein
MVVTPVHSSPGSVSVQSWQIAGDLLQVWLTACSILAAFANAVLPNE